ncbi:MAG: hypothetical protein JRE18_00910 [Deltaproteobacteria bacterium]|jgi:hypothetical protein|nr:hypothetical protein [Deltaproteobacteria bacterium]
MASKKIGTLSPQDKAAFLQTSRNLGLNPYEFGGLIQLESGFRPNIWGGSGGNYRGLIQVGPGPRQEVGLPSKDMTIAEQLPYVEKYFQQRGYKPGMGIEKAYATVLVGNPGGSLDAKDSNQTTVRSAVPRMKAGGDLYKAAQATLGDIDLPVTQPQQDPSKQQEDLKQTQLPTTQQQLPVNIFITTPASEERANDFLSSYVNLIKGADSFDQSKDSPLNPMYLMETLSKTTKYS